MKKPKIVVIDGGYDDYGREIDLLESAGYTFKLYPGDDKDREGKKAFARDAVGLFVRWTHLDTAFFQACPSLKAVVRYGVGYDNIDLEAATSHKVKVANVQGYANQSVSDHALALMFACARALNMRQEQIASHFTKPARKPMWDFHQKTLGIIGLGRIGGELCRKASCLFETIIAADPYVEPVRFKALGAMRTSLDNLLEKSHVISLHCNLTQETRLMIDHLAFNKMNQKPIFINTSRGPVVDESALYTALRTGQIHSAGLDVYTDEPPTSNQNTLLRHPHVVATGHYAWYSEDAAENLQKRAAENMLNLLNDRPVEDLLNFEQAGKHKLGTVSK